MSNSSPIKSPRFYLTRIFGDTVNVKVIEILLKNLIEEQKSEQIFWKNFSDISKEAKVAKSSGKRILDSLIDSGFIEEKKIITHAQSPPRFIRLNANHPAISDLLFFFKKVRGFL